MSQLGDPDGDDTNHFPSFQLGMFLEYQPPIGLDFGLLPDRVPGEGLIDGRECRVAMDIWVL